MFLFFSLKDTLKSCAEKLDLHIKQHKINDENSALFRIDASSFSQMSNTLIQMSAQKKVSSARKRLIPSFQDNRRALTPSVRFSGLNDTSFLNKTSFNIANESILMQSGNFSQTEITFNTSTVKSYIHKMLHSYNRRLIWSCLQQILTKYKGNVLEICLNTDEEIP